MRALHLLAVDITNFRSFRGTTRIEFPKEPGFRYIGGRNESEPALGANGVGKSSLWDAVIWCLYGTSARDLRTSELISWGERRTSVTTFWDVNENPVIITRSGPPNRLLMGDELGDAVPIEQTDIDAFIGLNKSRFMQSVIFGQLVPLFVDLDLPRRVALLDRMLDLDIWLRAAERASDRARDITATITRARLDIEHGETEIKNLPDIEKLRAASITWRNERVNEIEKILQSIELDEHALIEAENAFRDVQASTSKKTITDTTQAIENVSETLGALRNDQERIRQKVVSMQERLQFYAKNSICPTCQTPLTDAARKQAQQSITDALRDESERIKENSDRINILMSKLSGHREKAETARAENSRRAIIVGRAETQVKLLAQRIESQTQLASRLADTIDENPHIAMIKRRNDDAERLHAQIEAARARLADSESLLLRAQFWVSAFKRVRLFLINRVLTTLEVEVNSAAEILGLKQWHVSFTTETTTKSDTTKFGLQIEIASPTAKATWEAWSGGESQRLRLAVSLGLSSMIHRFAAINIGFEVFDEPSAWLSTEGIENLLECLAYRADMQRKTIWVVDHRALTFAGFDEIWNIVKTPKGSSLRKGDVIDASSRDTPP